ncbi:MAG: TIGR02646 family protein [Flavobacteriales bacterium]|nr:TIGR02646 family protein [Flavobacteriales bacterium]
MRKLNRSKVSPPDLQYSTEGEKTFNELRKFYAQPLEKRSQIRHKAPQYSRDVNRDLLETSNNACAYCEAPLNEKTVHIDLYRPVKVEPNEQVGDHYWWLLFDWQNMLPICNECSFAKGAQFPIAGKRVPIKHADDQPRGSALEKEEPYLLNPYEDDPEEYFDYSSNGMIKPRSTLGHMQKRRAEVTIETLDLNRKSAINRRSDMVHRVRDLTKSLVLKKKGEKLPRTVEEDHFLKGLIDPQSPMRNLSNHVLKEDFGLKILIQGDGLHVETISKGLNKPGSLLEAETGARTKPGSTRANKESPKKTSSEAQRTPPKTATENAPSKEKVAHQALTISKLIVENYRIFEKAVFLIPQERLKDLVDTERELNLDLNTETAGGNQEERRKTIDENGSESPQQETFRHSGWKMLLGENGSGKSSLLEALALILSGKKALSKMKEHFSTSLRRGATSGRIEVYFHQRTDPIVVNITNSGLKWEQGEVPNIFLRAYGPVRLLPQKGKSSDLLEKRGVNKNIQNLFDPFYPMVDAEEWLRTIVVKNQQQFFDVCVALKDLLDLTDNSTRLDFQFENNKPTQFGLFVNGSFTRLKHFSAGYKTMVGLACDIMAGNPTDTHQIRGVVLIDEIGAHLHPSWRMSILRRLEQTFPLIQFIASTHEPLCLHGLGAGEVALVKRNVDDPSMATVHDDMDSPAGLRSDQLLTSELFGLSTTLDPRTAEFFDRYYNLIAKASALDDSGKAQLKDLHERLNRKSILGSSRRDMYLLRLIDEHLMKSPTNVRFPKPTKKIIEALTDASWRLNN